MSDSSHNQEQATCHYHPQRAAFVRCGECGKFLCADCVRHGPVGTRCIECLLGVVIRPVSRWRRFAAAAAALATAVVIASALGRANLLNWLTAVGLGLAVGQVTKMLVHRIVTPGVQAAAGSAAALGAYCGVVVSRTALLVRAGASQGALAHAAASVNVGEWWLPALIAVGVAIYWVRRP